MFCSAFRVPTNLRNQPPTSLWRCDSSPRTVWTRYLWRQVASHNDVKRKSPFVLTPGRSMVCYMAILYSSGSNWRRQRSTQCQKNIDGLELTVEDHLHFRMFTQWNYFAVFMLVHAFKVHHTNVPAVYSTCKLLQLSSQWDFSLQWQTESVV